MLPETISYTFDHDDDGGTTAVKSVALTRNKENPDSSVYRTASHNDTVQTDLMQFSRAAAKRSGDYLGNEKTGWKRTKTFQVKDAAGNDIKANAIADCNFSLPYGMTIAQKLEFLMELIGFPGSAEGKAALKKMFNYQDV